MADIQTTVLIKYGIDIAQENIFKLYKIDTADISPQDIEDKIQETRKRWNTSINGANEKNAERDKIRLEKADKYETILKEDEDEKRKTITVPLIVNLFQEATILKIRRAFDKFDEAAQNAEICKKYPKIRDGLYEFLEIGDVKDAEQFAELMSAKGKEIYAISQER